MHYDWLCINSLPNRISADSKLLVKLLMDDDKLKLVENIRKIKTLPRKVIAGERKKACA